MNDTKFNFENKDLYHPIDRTISKSPRMVRWIMSTGLVKSETTANHILIGATILFFALTAVISMDLVG